MEQKIRKAVGSQNDTFCKKLSANHCYNAASPKQHSGEQLSPSRGFPDHDTCHGRSRPRSDPPPTPAKQNCGCPKSPGPCPQCEKRVCAPRAGAVTSWPQLREHGSPGPIIRGAATELQLHSCPSSRLPHATFNRRRRLFRRARATVLLSPAPFLIPTSFFLPYSLSNSQW